MNENNSNENVNNEVENKVEYVPKSKKSRKGDDGIYVQYRKPSFFSTILLVLIGILIGIVIMLLVYVVKTHKDLELYKEDVPVVEQPQEENNTQEVVENTENTLKISLNSEGEFIKLIYGKLPQRGPINLSYKKTLINYDSISDNEKLLFTFDNMESHFKSILIIKDKLDNKINADELIQSGNLGIAMYEMDRVSNVYKNIYGPDKEVPLIDVETHMGYVYEYVSEDNCFYGHSYPGGGAYGGYESLRKITSCEVNDDGSELYIYDSYVAIYYGDSSPEGNRWNIYNSADLENPVATNILETYSEDKSLFDGKTKDELLNEYLNSNPGKYKHTFKLDSIGNYYWYSSEPVK